MSIFSIGLMLNVQSLVDYLKKIMETSNSTQATQQDLRCYNTKFQLRILIFQEYPVFCQFYYRNDREGNRAFTEISEAL